LVSLCARSVRNEPFFGDRKRVTFIGAGCQLDNAILRSASERNSVRRIGTPELVTMTV
jgi:hypothetical protein